MEERNRITYSLLKETIGTRLQRHLAVFLHYKNLYENSCVYDWNFSRAAKASGDSRAKSRKYIRAFLGRGWCYEHCGHLTFKRIEDVSKIETGRVGLIFSVYGKRNKDIHVGLFELALRLKVQQCHKRRLDESSPDPDSNTDVGFKGEMDGAHQPLSYGTLRNIWGVQNPSHILRKIEADGDVSVKRHPIEKLGAYRGGKVEYPMFVHKGYVYRGVCNSYRVLKKRPKPFKHVFNRMYRNGQGIPLIIEAMREFVETGRFSMKYIRENCEKATLKELTNTFGTPYSPYNCILVSG